MVAIAVESQEMAVWSWIFSTLAPSLRKRLVDLNPTTAKDAWTYIEAIFQDNKRPRAMALKAKLHNLKLRDLSIDGVQNPLVDATSASPMVLLAKSNTSARRGPSLEKVNNPCWSFAKVSCRFGDACKYLYNAVHGKSILLPRTSGSASSVPGVTSSDLDMLQSLLAKFGLNAPNISTPLLQSLILIAWFFWGVQYGNGWVIPIGGSVSDGVTTAGGPLSTAGGSDAFWSTAGGSPCTWNFIAASSVYDRGSTTARGLSKLDFRSSFRHDNSCTVEFGPFWFFWWKDSLLDGVLLHCDSKSWYNTVKLPFVSSSSSVTSFLCFDIVLSDWDYPNDVSLCRYKARLVANGSTQVEGVDVDETFSPVVKLGTIRTVLSLAISRHWPVHQLDVKNAFLHGDLAETVYMHQPPGFRDPEHPDYVCLLQRSLYGLKQAPRAWFQRFAAYITTVGFTPSRCDSSLFIYRQGDDTTFLLLYVDDICKVCYGYVPERDHMVGCNPSRGLLLILSHCWGDGAGLSYMHDPPRAHFSVSSILLGRAFLVPVLRLSIMGVAQSVAEGHVGSGIYFYGGDLFSVTFTFRVDGSTCLSSSSTLSPPRIDQLNLPWIEVCCYLQLPVGSDRALSSSNVLGVSSLLSLLILLIKNLNQISCNLGSLGSDATDAQETSPSKSPTPQPRLFHQTTRATTTDKHNSSAVDEEYPKKVEEYEERDDGKMEDVYEDG
ncbi:ribonuclease H-like domain-containing protein [Tanacetum coccineum]